MTESRLKKLRSLLVRLDKEPSPTVRYVRFVVKSAERLVGSRSSDRGLLSPFYNLLSSAKLREASKKKSPRVRR